MQTGKEGGFPGVASPSLTAGDGAIGKKARERTREPLSLGTSAQQLGLGVETSMWPRSCFNVVDRQQKPAVLVPVINYP